MRLSILCTEEARGIFLFCAISMKPSISAPRLSRVCLLALIISLGFFVHELRTQGHFDFAFLLSGAIGCVYLLLLSGEHYAAQQRYHSMPSRLRDIQYGALPLHTIAGERPVSTPAYRPDRRRPNGLASWPRHLERRKSVRSARSANG